MDPLFCSFHSSGSLWHSSDETFSKGRDTTAIDLVLTENLSLTPSLALYYCAALSFVEECPRLSGV